MIELIATYVSWWLLPGIITNLVQRTYYSLTHRAGVPHPAPNSPRHVHDARYIRIGIIIAYFLYTLWAAHLDIHTPPTYYDLLGVPHDVTDKALQSRFRRLTVSFHPDKIAPGADRAAAEALYVHLQSARDVLSDPVRRFAYDRFGAWPFNATVAAANVPRVRAEYLGAGLREAASFYVGVAVFGGIAARVMGLKAGTFWRFWMLAVLATFEAWVAMRPRWPGVLTGVLNPVLMGLGIRNGYLPFQLVAMLRRAMSSVMSAGFQLNGLLRTSGIVAQEKDGEIAAPVLDRLDATTMALDQELTRIMALEMAPYLTNVEPGDGRRQEAAMSGTEAVPELRTGLMEWLLQNTIRNDPRLRAAIVAGVEKRRRGEVSS